MCNSQQEFMYEFPANLQKEICYPPLMDTDIAFNQSQIYNIKENASQFI